MNILPINFCKFLWNLRMKTDASECGDRSWAPICIPKVALKKENNYQQIEDFT